MNTSKLMVSIREAAEMTGLSYSCIRKLCMNRQIVHIRSGKKYFVNLPKLMDYLNDAS